MYVSVNYFVALVGKICFTKNLPNVTQVLYNFQP